MTCTRVCGATDCQFKSLAFLFFVSSFFKRCLLGIFLAWIIKDVCF